MTWSIEQALAINLTGKNITVSAGAGAGKTAVLIARLTKRIIEDQISVENILAITFTEAAANEIKKRLTKSLSDCYKTNPSDYIAKQLALLASANISTIHSFCLYIIKNYYYVLGLDKNITANILDPAMSCYYKQQAVKTALAELMIDPEFDELYRLSTSNDPSMVRIKATIIELAQMALASGSSDKWLDQALTNFERFNSLSELPITIKNIFWEMLADNYQQYLDNLELLASNISDISQMAIMQSRLAHARSIKEFITKQDYPAYRKAYLDNVKLKITIKRTDDARHYLSAAENAFKDISDYLYPQDVFLNDLNFLHPAANILVKLAKAYIHHYSLIKTNLKLMDFDDMEMMALKILSENNALIANQIKQHFSDILVDEYQDTNIIQDKIINLVSNGSNVFRVGDVKQSIYRFRNAQPMIMTALINNPTENHEVIFLKENYRSKQSIIDFNNALFKQLLNIKQLNNRFTESDLGLVGIPKQHTDNCPVELHYLDIVDEETNNNQLKAGYIAYKIKELHVKDKVKYGDICILVTTHLIKDTIRRQLEYRDIPVYGKGSAGLFKSRGVLAVLNYLSLINDLDDSIALLGVLVSFYQFTDDQLALLKLNDANLFIALKNLFPDVYESIIKIKSLYGSVLLSELVASILLVNDFYELQNNQKQQANIDLLFETINTYQLTSGSIDGFLELINAQEDKDANEALAISEEDDVVKIMTIHQSKGLQFKHVFFFSINRTKTKRSDSLIYSHNDIGFSLPLIDKPYRYQRIDLIKLAIKQKEFNEDLSERLRNLYVALTRSQQYLYIIDIMPKIEDGSLDLAFLRKNNFTSWIFKALANVPNNLYKIINVDNPWAFDETAKIEQKSINYPRYQNKTNLTKLTSPSKTKPASDHFALDLSSRLKADQIGTKLHELIERLPNAIWSDDELDKYIANELLDYRDHLVAFNHSALYQKCLLMDIKKEVPFVIKENDEFIYGIIDFLAISDQEAIIIDFKSDRNVNSEILLERYQKQLALYQKAIMTIYPELKIKAYVYALTLNDFIDMTNR